MWQCSYVDSRGIRCEAIALHRIHFANDHPFDHYDVCAEHFEEYKHYCWVQPLHSGDRDAEERMQ